MDAAKPKWPDERADRSSREAVHGADLERQRMERALRDSEALYESLVESLSQNIFRKDRYGRFTYVNRRFCETVGKSRSDILGKTDFDLFPPAMAAKYSTDDHRVFETGVPIEVVEEHRLPSGALKQVQVVKTVVLDAQGQIVGVQGIFWDITEKRLAEERLAQSERRYRQLTEATLDAIVLTNEAGAVELFNPAAERMFGFQAAEVVGAPATFLDSAEYRRLHDDSLAAFRGGRIADARLDARDESPASRRRRVPGRGGPQRARLGRRVDRPRPFPGGDPRSHRADEAPRHADPEREAGVDRPSCRPGSPTRSTTRCRSSATTSPSCSATASRSWRWSGRSMPNRDRLPPDLAGVWNEKSAELDLPYVEANLTRLLDRTRDGVDRVSRIVHSLRGMARTDPPRRHDVNLVDLIDGSLEIIRGKYKRSGIEVDARARVAADRLVRLDADQPGSPQPPRERVPGASRRLEAEGGRIAVRTQRVGGELEIAIADNGPGIPADVLDRIFDPFFTTKDVGEGTGLGLSISHSIVTGHGGRIEVDGKSELGGARFRVYLPANPVPRGQP